MRHELKYMLNPIQYELLRNRLKWVMQIDENGREQGEYFIRSIYYDSPDRTALQEKRSGINRRRKYRIRFYNGDASYCRLECKEKTGSRIEKRSCRLTGMQTEKLLGIRKELPEIQTKEKMQDVAEDVLLGRLRFLMEKEGYEPVVTVDYVREAYVMPLSELRITFDKQLAWGPVENCLGRERYLPNVYGENVILEVKYNDYLPQHISAIIASVAPVQISASKYVACMMEQYGAWK